MRFTLPALTLLLTTLHSSLTSACLILTSNYELGFMYVQLVDNGILRCAWQGKYTSGTEQYLHCATGFYAWINLPQAPNGQTGIGNGVGAYAYNGLNFRFGITRRETECLLYRSGRCANWAYVLEARSYGCSAGAMAKVGGGEGLIPSDVDGWSVSTTSHVVISAGTAVPFAA